MKKIIRNILCAGLFILSFSFTSCELIFDLIFSGFNTSYSADIDLKGILTKDSEVYLVQTNTSSTSVNAGVYMTGRNYRSAEGSDSKEPVLPENKPVNNIPKFVQDAYTMEINVPETNSARSAIFTDTYEPVDWVYNTVRLGDEISFWVIGKNPNYQGGLWGNNEPEEISILEPFIFKASGTYCRIFTPAEGDVYLSTSVLQSLANKFDSIYAAETNILGKTVRNERYNKFSYIDSESGETEYDSLFVPLYENDKINILVYDIYDSESVGGHTLGYFYSVDLINPKYLSSGSYSNETEVFYVDSEQLIDFPDSIYSTLAHEFCHMLNYITKVVNVQQSVYQNKVNLQWDSMLTEMLAMNTEDLLSDYFNPDADVRTVYKERIPGFNTGYMNGMVWGNPITTSDYSNTFAFGAYLIRNFGGVELFKAIANNSYIGTDSIDQALKDCNQKRYDATSNRYQYVTFESALENFFQVFLNTGIPENSDVITLNRAGGSTINGKKYTYDAIKINSESYRWDTYISSSDMSNWEKLKEEDKLGNHEGKGMDLYGANYKISPIGPYGFVLQKVQDGNDYNTFSFTKTGYGNSNPYILVKNPARSNYGDYYVTSLDFQKIEQTE